MTEIRWVGVEVEVAVAVVAAGAVAAVAVAGLAHTVLPVAAADIADDPVVAVVEGLVPAPVLVLELVAASAEVV